MSAMARVLTAGACLNSDVQHSEYAVRGRLYQAAVARKAEGKEVGQYEVHSRQ